MEKIKTTTVIVESELRNDLKLQAVMNGVSLADLTSVVLRKAIENKELLNDAIKEVKNGLGKN
jgi:hypothetical protein